MADNLICHVKQQGYVILDHDPTDAETARYLLIAKIVLGARSYNAEHRS